MNGIARTVGLKTNLENAAMNEMIKTGDPVLRIKLPNNVIALLKTLAKQNKRRHQDEFIKRLAASFRQNHITESVQAKLIPQLQKIYQV